MNKNDYTNDLNELFNKAGNEIHKLNAKESISREEVIAAKEAVCLMHMIDHFEDDNVKYGWNDDVGYSQKGWALTELPMRSPYAYAPQSPYMSGNSRAYPMGMYGNSYNDSNGYSRHGDPNGMIAAIENLDERDRASAMEYINRLRTRG